MNIVKSSTRTLLGNDTLNNLLEIKLNGETITQFNPDEAIIHWLETGSKMHHINGHKSKKQRKEV